MKRFKPGSKCRITKVSTLHSTLLIGDIVTVGSRISVIDTNGWIEEVVTAETEGLITQSIPERNTDEYLAMHPISWMEAVDE